MHISVLYIYIFQAVPRAYKCSIYIYRISLYFRAHYILANLVSEPWVAKIRIAQIN